MPRRGHIAHRDVLPDPVYGSKVVTKLINSIMLDGKKGVAQKIVYGAFDRIAEKTDKSPLEVFESAMNNIMPVLEVKARTCRRSYVSGSHGSARRAQTDPGAEMADHVFSCSW